MTKKTIRLKEAFALISSISVCWLVTLGWDLSEIDEIRRKNSNPYYSWWGGPLFLLLLGMLTFKFTERKAMRTTQVIWLSGITCLTWYAYRSSQARTDGANMWAVGVILFTPFFFGVPTIAANVANRRTKPRP
jgi:hypothetical protein